MQHHERRSFRRTDLYVAAACLSLLAMLFSPVLAQNVDDARLNTCMNHCKQMALGLLNHEAAKGFFPAASTAELSSPPGNDGETERAGYSWQTMTLPFMELQATYNVIRSASENFTKAPLAVRVKSGGDEIVAATNPIEIFLCPAFAGEPTVDVAASDYKSGDGGAPALTNYFAVSASHLAKGDGDVWLLGGSPTPEAVIQGDGVLAMFSKAGLDAAGSFVKIRGTTFAAIRDGSSNTFLFGEGREQAYAAWIDGQVAWVVAAWPQNPDEPQKIADPAEPTAQPTLGWTEAQRAANFATIAKQKFGVAEADAGVYLPEAMWSGTKDRKFGPSGNHLGIAMHSFADGHSKRIADTIDPAVYMHLTTRAGQEID